MSSNSENLTTKVLVWLRDSLPKKLPDSGPHFLPRSTFFKLKQFDPDTPDTALKDLTLPLIDRAIALSGQSWSTFLDDVIGQRLKFEEPQKLLKLREALHNGGNLSRGTKVLPETIERAFSHFMRNKDPNRLNPILEDLVQKSPMSGHPRRDRHTQFASSIWAIIEPSHLPVGITADHPELPPLPCKYLEAVSKHLEVTQWDAAMIMRSYLKAEGQAHQNSFKRRLLFGEVSRVKIGDLEPLLCEKAAHPVLRAYIEQAVRMEAIQEIFHLKPMDPEFKFLQIIIAFDRIFRIPDILSEIKAGESFFSDQDYFRSQRKYWGRRR